MDGTRHEYLGGGITAVVSEAHSFGTDAVLLAHFASPGKRAVCCALGSGCGIIPLLWCRHEGGVITAVELQPLGVKQIEAAIELNSLSDRLTAVNADLRDLKGRVPFGCFDLVTMNPPYKASGAGIESSSAPDKIARHETMCLLSEVCASAAKLLNFGGRFKAKDRKSGSADPSGCVNYSARCAPRGLSRSGCGSSQSARAKPRGSCSWRVAEAAKAA